jgi:hypothetical protein
VLSDIPRADSHTDADNSPNAAIKHNILCRNLHLRIIADAHTDSGLCTIKF